jgi:NodT family efflux transporter outer membrane factor (OMF) lipoprotein
MSRTLILAAALLASGCAGSQAAKMAIPDEGKGAFISAAPNAVTADAASEQWWKLYNDPALDALIDEALRANTDLRAAEANLRAVRASLGEARVGQYLPQTNLSGSATRGRVAANTVPGSTSQLPIEDEYQAGLDVSYEIDLFGRVRHGVAAARADRDAAAAARDVVRISVAAETARAFADACAANAQLAVVNRTIELQRDTADLTQRLLDAGRGNGLDTARANALLESARANAPTFAAARDEALFRLATLLGRPPARAPAEARDCARNLTLSSLIPVGDGAAMLARRPDVRQASRQVRASAERVGVAVADLLPTISLGASAGVIGPEARDLDQPTAFRFSVGPLISWSFPNVFGARQRVEAAGARANASLAQFDGVVLAALQETETALSAYANELDRLAALTRARDQSAEAARLAQLRFDAGADSFLTLLDSQRTQAQAEAAFAASEAQTISKQITLFKALGGGWRDAPPVKR